MYGKRLITQDKDHAAVALVSDCWVGISSHLSRLCIFFPILMTVKKKKKLKKEFVFPPFRFINYLKTIIPAPIRISDKGGLVIRKPVRAANSRMYTKEARTCR